MTYTHEQSQALTMLVYEAKTLIAFEDAHHSQRVVRRAVRDLAAALVAFERTMEPDTPQAWMHEGGIWTTEYGWVNADGEIWWHSPRLHHQNVTHQRRVWYSPTEPLPSGLPAPRPVAYVNDLVGPRAIERAARFANVIIR